MDTAHIGEFLVFTETMNYTQAARQLFVSPSALADHVHKLEDELGARLVEGSTGSLALTPAGRAFVRMAPQVVSDVEALASACRSSMEAVPLSLAGYTFPADMVVLSGACAEYERQTGRHVEISLRSLVCAGTTELEHREDADAAFVFSPSRGADAPEPPRREGFAYEHVAREPMLVSIPKASDLFARERVRVTDLGGHAFICFNDPVLVEDARAAVGFMAEKGADVSLTITQGTNPFEYLYGTRPDYLGFWVESVVRAGGMDAQQDFRFVQVEGLGVVYDTYFMYRPDRPHLPQIAALMRG